MAVVQGNGESVILQNSRQCFGAPVVLLLDLSMIVAEVNRLEYLTSIRASWRRSITQIKKVPN